MLPPHYEPAGEQYRTGVSMGFAGNVMSLDDERQEIASVVRAIN
jgi:hypothetical protein